MCRVAVAAVGQTDRRTDTRPMLYAFTVDMIAVMTALVMYRYSWSDEHCSVPPVYAYNSTPFTVTHRINSLMVSSQFH